MSLDRAIARVNLDAIARNCERLRGELSDGVQLCAVVKADGYGHGMLASARGALAGGATWLAVASLLEARELLIDEVPTPVLVLGPLQLRELEEVVATGLDFVVWREQLIAQAAAVAEDIGRPARVHIKLDTGMGRFGVRDPERASALVAAAAADPNVELVGIMTHFATADERGDAFFGEQLRRFSEWAQAVEREHPDVIVHAANSAAVLRERAAHFDMVRCGIAVYGMDPFGEDPLARGLEPALELSSYLAVVKRCRAGESVGYGRRFIATRDTYVGLLPIGYGDGWRRGLSGNAEVLIGGCRHPLVGTVSMDSVAVDLGPDPEARKLLDQPAILIGAQGDARITAEELARRLDTINYEITCGLTARVPRLHYDEHGVIFLADGE
ncbi:MAG TPA: alanine racemase [Solirubrobacteraceae bacterium]|jgi:alanine racemase|nr:alanine racemase [Solirubrobacteraceae bacterium]